MNGPEIGFNGRFLTLVFALGEGTGTAMIAPEAVIGILPHPDGGSTIILPGQAFGRFLNEPAEIQGAVFEVLRRMSEARMPSVVPVEKRLIRM
jgi:hypothetical protein